MCTSPITIYNNSRYVNLTGFDVKRTVPCGHCWQCQIARQSEYAIRSYYEWQESLDLGSYAFWQTLTYRDENLPKCFGVPCFRKSDIQEFIKRLRYDLKSKYGLGKGSFRYFVVSEYGDKLHRPHYHIIIFCKWPLDRCTPYQLNKLILDNWRPYNGNTDFMHGKDPDSLVIRSNAGLMYVMKYLYKDYDNFAKLRDAVQQQISLRFPDVVISNASFRKRFQNFQVHSLGFGSYLLDVCDVSDFKCYMPTKDNPKKEYNLPLYYLRMRKDCKNVLPYYDLIERDPEKYQWVCTPLMVQFKLSKLAETINKGAISLRTRIDNLSSQVEYLKLNDYATFEKILYRCFPQNWPADNISDYLSSLYDLNSLRSLYIYAVSRQYRLDDVSSVEDVIYNRCCDLGNDINPLRYDLSSDAGSCRDFYSFECYKRGVPFFDRTLDLLNFVSMAYGKIKLRSELSKMAISRRLST